MRCPQNSNKLFKQTCSVFSKSWSSWVCGNAPVISKPLTLLTFFPLEISNLLVVFAILIALMRLCEEDYSSGMLIYVRRP